MIRILPAAGMGILAACLSAAAAKRTAALDG